MKADYPLRILQVTGVMNRGGAETMIMNLYRRIDRSRVQFDFVEHTDEKAVFDEEIYYMGGRIYHCPRFNGENYLAYKRWWNDFFEKDGAEYTVVHGHIGSTAGIYLKAAKNKGKYTIVHSHNTKGCLSVKEILYRMMSRQARKVSDSFFACSQSAGTDRFGKKTEFHMINNAIETGKYIFSGEKRSEVRKELSLEEEYVMGHVGRFSPQKNHTFLIDVFMEMKKKKNNIKLLLVGVGDTVEQIRQKVRKLNLEDSVIFAGECDDVSRLLQAMDVFVFPSLFEGLPVAMVEAQAAGLPCVISDKVPAECIITHGLVTVKKLSNPPTEWAEHILEKMKIRRRDTGQEIRKNGFDIKDTAQWMEDFYLEHGKK